jgi:hypothetical protein
MRPERFAVSLAIVLFGFCQQPAWSQVAMLQAAKPPAPAKPAKPAGEGEVKGSERADVCYNYSCVAEGNVTFSAKQLTRLRDMLAAATNSERERAALAQAIGQMYAWAAEQTPVGNDKAGNFADGGMPGQMDCIDHSTTTTRFLRLLEKRGWMRFHRAVDGVRRGNPFSQHLSAAIEDLGDGVSVVRIDARDRLWAVDSWYADNGKPPYVATLDEWERAGGPN